MGNWFTKEIDIVQQKTEVRAGLTFEIVCTLQISPDAWVGPSQVSLPSVECIGFDKTDRYNGLEWTRNADGVLEMTICVCAKKAGPRPAQLKFTPQVRIKESNCYVDVLDVPFTVKVPASSHYSRLTKETLDIINGSPDFEAGAEVVFELELYDIWNNALLYTDSDASTKFHGELKSKTDENEQTVSEDRLTDQLGEVHIAGSKSNLCQFKFVPIVAGKHELYLTIGREPVRRSPLSFNVLPSRIHSLCADVASRTFRVRSEEIKLKVTAFDQFKNVVSLNNQLHKLEISSLSADEARTGVLPMTTEDDKRLCRGVIFHTAGEHSVKVSVHTTSDNKMAATHEVIVNVTLPPIFLTQSTPPFASPMATKAEEQMLYEDEPLFASSKTFLTLNLNKALGDEFVEFEPSEIKTLVQNALRITIDGQKMEMHKLQVHSGTVKFDISGIGDAGERLLELFFRDKCIIELWLNVVGIQELPKEYIDKAAARINRELVLLNFEGEHFRRQARELDNERRKWQQRAEEAYDKGQDDKASFSRRTKEMYGELMSKANDKASKSIFGYYNYDRNQSKIDLHELLVADEEKLKKYREQLQNYHRYKTDDEIDRLIRKKRTNDNEAIRMLEHRLENYNYKRARSNHCPWLEIIVGAGQHSHGQRQRIRPEVEKFLKQKDLEYGVINKGSLLVTFKKYGGTQPCVAEYYCEKCDKTWTSALAWVDKFQSCRYHPKQRCLPLKLRPRDSKLRDSPPTDPAERERRKTEHIRSCQMCKELEEYCGSSSVTTRRA